MNFNSVIAYILIIIIIIKIKFYTAIIHGKILNNLSEASAL